MAKERLVYQNQTTQTGRQPVRRLDSSHDKWRSSQPVKTTPQMTRFRDVQQAIIMATV